MRLRMTNKQKISYIQTMNNPELSRWIACSAKICDGARLGKTFSESIRDRIRDSLTIFAPIEQIILCIIMKRAILCEITSGDGKNACIGSNIITWYLSVIAGHFVATIGFLWYPVLKCVYFVFCDLTLFVSTSSPLSFHSKCQTAIPVRHLLTRSVWRLLVYTT